MRMRTAALLGAVLLGSALCSRKAEAQGAIACESIENRYRNCPVSTRGSARVDVQLSDTPCIYGRTWGFDYNSIWVDRGCRARFRVAGSGAGWQSGGFGRHVTCESIDNRYRACDVNTRGDVRMVRQLSKDPCIAGRSWGFERNRIWVANGCRAEFEVGYNDVDWSDGDRTVKCESEDSRYRRCRVWTYGTVRIQRQLSQTSCRLNRNWGYDRDGIWVNDGCRAIFFIGAGGGGWGGWKPPPGGGGGGGGGNSSLVNRGRSACEQRALTAGYGSVSVRNSYQSGSNVVVEMNARRGRDNWYLRCNYRSSSNSATITEQSQGR